MSNSLLSESLDVRVKPADREEYVAALALKITNNSSMRPLGLLIELTSESDLFLYFSVRLSDIDFHALKLEQRLLVDFAQLPAMIKQLLSARQMSTVLAIDPSGDATLSLVEANQFRELVHLTLRLRAGSDESIKGYLAGRLGQFKAATSALETSCTELTEELKRMSREKISAESEATRARQEAESVAAKCQSALAQLREEHAREIRSLHMSSTSEHSVETRRLAEQVRMLEDRNRETEKKFEETRLSLMSSESQLSGYVRKVQSLESEKDVSGEGVRRAQIENREIVNRNYELEKNLAELTVETKSLREQLRNKDSLISNSTQLVDQSTGQCKHLETSLSSYKMTVGQCEEKIAQLESALASRDALVKKLQLKAKEAKWTIKETQQALLAQESVLTALTREAENETKLKAQLAESTQVIAYLNKKLNDQAMFGKQTLALPNTSSSIYTPAIIPEYPNRSFLSTYTAGSNNSAANLSSTLPPDYARGPIKFTARSGQPTALIK